MTTYWCKLNSIYPIFAHGVGLGPVQHGYGYRDLMLTWESSLRRAYDLSDELHAKGGDPLLLVFEIEERGARGQVLEHEPYYVAMFSRAARESFRTHVGRRPLAVADIEYMESASAFESGAWYLPSGLLKTLCLGYFSFKYDRDELVRRSRRLYREWQADTVKEN